MGHFMRCFALGQEATRQDWSVYFAGNFSDDARNLLVSKLPDATLNEIDPKSVVDELQQYVWSVTPDVVHLDSYLHELDDFTFEDGVLSNAQDGVFGARKALINIDANLGAEIRSAKPEFGRALFGIEYAQIRDEVRLLNHEVHPIISRALKVLVVLGGTDPLGATPSVVQGLSRVSVLLDLTVVCRKSLHQVVNQALQPGWSSLKLLTFVSDLPALANEQDLVITTASTALWDFASMGLPICLIETAENQSETYAAAVRSGIAYPLGRANEPQFVQQLAEKFETACDSSRLIALALHTSEVVDGLGVWRIVSSWQVLMNNPVTRRPTESLPGLFARPATNDDAELLLNWRNDFVTRSVSRQSKVISLEEHRMWLQAVIGNPSRQLFLIENQTQAVATVRWDEHDTGTWEVSITVNPEFRGRGLAHAVLVAGERALQASQSVRLLATVHEDNVASRRLFTKAGYLPFLPADNDGFAKYAKRKD